MRTAIGLVNKYSNKTAKDFDYSILLNKNIYFDQNKLIKMSAYLKQYKTKQFLLSCLRINQNQMQIMLW